MGTDWEHKRWLVQFQLQIILLEQLDSYVTPGSAVTIFADAEDVHAIERQTPTSLARLTVQVQVGSTTDRRLLDALAIE